ncbi:MAG: ribosome maturation factor RimP [Clostridia bacterium]|nr:ribosome maturation factor RimP [Clostridia bacterium]
MSEIKDKTLKYSTETASSLGLYIWDIEYVKEGKQNILRIYIDKENDGVSIDECVLFSRALEEVLDREDFISDSYVLEVSSPGIDRKLKTDKHFEMFLEAEVFVKTHTEVNGSKEHRGRLKAHDKKNTVIENEEETVEFENKNIIFVKLNS